ncbi:cytochrome c oxidase subunit II [Antarcticirhabdus aurantiaca]|uniref:cytochrome c oxidase subunit II n=2 Tax=Antarcticirhabdus aurantiaca TaxID=2606717 RepID=UPI0034E26B0D
MSALDPAGPNAASTALLWWVMLAGSSAIFLFVSALLALALLKPGLGANVPPKRWLVWGGLAFPGVVLSALLVFALATGERLLPHPGTQAYTVEALPEQWLWRFRYPGGGESVGTLHIPAGQPVDVRVIGTDVIHSFWVPRLGGKIDAIPGHVNTIRLTADRPGSYGGVCSEFCGTGHTGMIFTALAHEAEGFEAALAAVLSGEAPR